MTEIVECRECVGGLLFGCSRCGGRGTHEQGYELSVAIEKALGCSIPRRPHRSEAERLAQVIEVDRQRAAKGICD